MTRPGLVLVQAWIPKDQHRAAKAAAKRDGSTMSEWLRTAIRASLRAGKGK